MRCPDWAGRKLASPAYVAVRVLVPAEPGLSVQFPLVRMGAVQLSPSPSAIDRVPVGAIGAVDDPVNCTATGCNGTDGFGVDEVILSVIAYFATRFAVAGPLAACIGVAVKPAQMVRVPTAIGVTLAVQVETPGAAGARTHALNTSPAIVVLRATVPPGLNFWNALVSVTVTETVAGVPTATSDGVTVSEIVVGRGLTASVADPELFEWMVRGKKCAQVPHSGGLGREHHWWILGR